MALIKVKNKCIYCMPLLLNKNISTRLDFFTFTTTTYINKLKESTYEQGQYPSGNIKIREYFYYIDHQGMLYLDDTRIKNFTSCFKDKKFLKFFFTQLKINKTDRYTEFPFISLCGRERNFIRCDDLPIVFTEIINNDTEYLSYANGGESLMMPFEPEKLVMEMETGRIYHPGPKVSGGVGLVSSKLGIYFSPYFKFNKQEDTTPTEFLWNGILYKLTYDLVKALKNIQPLRKYSLGIENI